jgi:hypothetical protein
MPRQSIWDREWTVRNADGPGGHLIYSGAPWKFRLRDINEDCRQYRLEVTEGTPPAGWGDFLLCSQGWATFRWLQPELPVWSSGQKTVYDERSHTFLANTGADVDHLALRLEGPLDASHTAKMIWVPDAVDNAIPDLMLICVADVAGGPLQGGLAQSDPR